MTQPRARPLDASHFPIDPHEELSLRYAIDLAGSMTPAQIFGWLVFLAGTTQRSINHLLEELSRMATNDADLTKAVQDLTAAFGKYTPAITAELANIKAANTPQTDPEITDAVSKIESIVAQMNQATAAAQAAIAPASADSTSSSAEAASTAPAPSPASAGSTA